MTKRKDWKWYLVVNENGNVLDSFNSADGAEGYVEAWGGDVIPVRNAPSSKRTNWEEQVKAWWKANDLDECAADPPPEATWDGYEFIWDLMKIINEEE